MKHLLFIVPICLALSGCQTTQTPFKHLGEPNDAPDLIQPQRPFGTVIFPEPRPVKDG